MCSTSIQSANKMMHMGWTFTSWVVSPQVVRALQYVKITSTVLNCDRVFFKHQYITQSTVTSYNAVIKACQDVKQALKGITNTTWQAKMKAILQLEQLMSCFDNEKPVTYHHDTQIPLNYNRLLQVMPASRAVEKLQGTNPGVEAKPHMALSRVEQPAPKSPLPQHGTPQLINHNKLVSQQCGPSFLKQHCKHLNLTWWLWLY